MTEFSGGIPSGTQDRLNAETASMRELETRLCFLFSTFGYSEVQTPTIEYYSTFLRAGVPLAEEDMFKFTDRDGRLVVLRPDSTTPAARVYASRLKSEQLQCRLFYFQNVFTCAPRHRGLYAEARQGGIELIGASGKRADVEMLALAVRAMEQCGLTNYHIEIGHAGLFRELTSALGGGDELSERLRVLVEQKNFASLGDALAPFCDNPAAEALLRLINLFGGADVLPEAMSLASSDEARAAVAYLSELYDELKAAGLDGYVRFDMGLVHRIDYYTGIVFQGFAEGAGVPVLSGGRYDGLVEQFGTPAPATGWAIDLDAVARCVKQTAGTAPRELVWYANGFLGDALSYIETSSCCELSLCATEQDSIDYAVKHCIATVVVITSSGVRRISI